MPSTTTASAASVSPAPAPRRRLRSRPQSTTSLKNMSSPSAASPRESSSTSTFPLSPSSQPVPDVNHLAPQVLTLQVSLSELARTTPGAPAFTGASPTPLANARSRSRLASMPFRVVDQSSLSAPPVATESKGETVATAGVAERRVSELVRYCVYAPAVAARAPNDLQLVVRRGCAAGPAAGAAASATGGGGCDENLCHVWRGRDAREKYVGKIGRGYRYQVVVQTWLRNLAKRVVVLAVEDGGAGGGARGASGSRRGETRAGVPVLLVHGDALGRRFSIESFETARQAARVKRLTRLDVYGGRSIDVVEWEMKIHAGVDAALISALSCVLEGFVREFGGGTTMSFMPARRRQSVSGGGGGTPSGSGAIAAAGMETGKQSRHRRVASAEAAAGEGGRTQNDDQTGKGKTGRALVKLTRSKSDNTVNANAGNEV